MLHQKKIISIVFFLLSVFFYENASGSFFYLGVSPTVMCEGSSGTLTFKVSSFFAGYSYHITGPGITPTTVISIGSGTQQSIVIPLSSNISAGNYQYSIELFSPNSLAPLKTVNVAFSYLQAPVFTSPIENVHVCTGSSASIVATTLGTITSYQWERTLNNSNDWEVLGTTNVLTIPNITSSIENYSFRCKIKNKSCTESTSNNFVIRVGAPIIFQEPKDVERCEKSTIELNVVASGENISYQWEYLAGSTWVEAVESVEVQGVTSATLKMLGIMSLNNTSFRCNISSNCGNTVSQECTVKIIPNPVNPIALFIPECTSSGTTTQRKLQITNPQIGLGYNILTPNYAVAHSYTHESGTDATLNITNLSSAENRVIVYSFLPSSLGCKSENVEISLLGSGNVLIGEQPHSITICDQETATFQVGNITGVPLSGGMQYQWEIENAGTFVALTDIATQLSGVNTPNLVFQTGVLLANSSYNGAKLRCKVTGQCGSIYSNEVTITIRNPININYNTGIINYQLQGTTYFLNGTLSTALPDVHYYFLSPDGNVKGDYTNTTTTIENNVAVQVLNLEPRILSLKIKANYASTPSCIEEVNLSLPNKVLPLILQQPEDVVAVPGSTVTFKCLSESPTATYSWYRSTDNQQNFYPLTSEVSSTLTINSAVASGNFYRCVINAGNPAIAQTSRAAFLTVQTDDATYQKPLSKTICNAEEILTTTVGTAIGGYTYRWQIFENNMWVNLSDNTLYSGITSTNLTILSPVENKIYRVRCAILTVTGLETTESADLKKVSLPTEINISTDLSLCVPMTGKTASLPLSVSPKAYQKYLWNTSETTSSIVVRENGTYNVEVSLEGCSTTLNIDINTFHQDNLNLDIQGVTNLGCSAADLEKQLFTLPEGFDSYHWSSSNSSSVSTTNSYSVFIDEPTTISLKFTDSKKCIISRTHQVFPTVNTAPNVEYIRKCIGTPTLVQGSSPIEVKKWLWYDDAGTIISQDKSFAYISQPGNYMLKVLYADGCVGTKRFSVDFEISNTTIANKNTQKEIFFCELSSVTLSTTVSHGTYSWVGPNGFLGTDPTISVSDVGKYYVTTTNAGIACPGIDTVYVRKYPAPPVQITASTQKICTSTAGILKPNRRLNAPAGYTSYLWNTGETASFIEVDRIGNYEYTLTVVDNNGCSNTTTHPVDIDYVGIYNKENALCANGELALEGTNGLYNYEWEWTMNGNLQTIDNPNSRVQLFNITAPSTLTLKVSERNNAACFITDVVNVQVGESPKVTITPNPGRTICSGSTVTLTSNIIGTINTTQWLYNDAIIGTSSSQVVNQPGTYKVIVENTESGCKASEIENITLQELPKIVIPSYQKVCLGHSTNLTALVQGATTNDYTYVWQDTFLNINYPVKIPGNYTVKVKHNTTGCENQQSITVDFLSTPPPTIIGNKSFTTTTLFNVSVLENYASYSWCTENTEKNIVLPQNTNCNVKVVDNKGCIASTDFTTSSNILALSINASAINVCYGTPIELILEDGFKSYKWYVNDELLPFAVKNKLNLKNVGDYTIYAIVTDYYGNSITTNSISTTIKPSPDISIQGNRTFCDAMPAQFLLVSSITTLAAYEWLKDGLPITADTDAPYKVSLINTPAIEGLYTLKATAINGCTTEVSDSIILRKSKAFVIAPTVACTADTILLKASAGYQQYTWQEAGIDIATSLYYKAFRTGRYSVKIYDKYGCNFQTPAHSILFSENVKFQIIGSPRVCDGDSVELRVSEIFSEYLWSTGETTPSIYVKEQNIYSITAFNSSTCSSTQEINIFRRPKYNLTVRDTACLGVPYQFGTHSITEPGIYQHQFLSREGCDSMVTLSLVFTDPPKPINIALNDKGILYLVDFDQKGSINWFAQDLLILRANDTKYEPLRNGKFHARFIKHGSCGVNSNEINVNIYSPLDVGIYKKLVEKDRKAPYYFNDIIPYKITIVNETDNVIGNNIVLQLTDFFDKNIFSLPINAPENQNWKVEGNDNNYTRISQTITIPEWKPKDSIHFFIKLKAESGGILVNNAEATLLQDNGKFAKEYADYLFNNKTDIDCRVRFSVSQLPLQYVVTMNPANRCVVIKPENQFTTEFYKIQIFLYNRAGQQVYNHQNFENTNKELCSDDFPAGTFIFVMKFTELDTKRETAISGTITNIK